MNLSLITAIGPGGSPGISAAHVGNLLTTNDLRDQTFLFNETDWPGTEYLCDVFYDGCMYPSVENAYHAAKVVREFRPHFVHATPKDAANDWRMFPLIDKDASDWLDRRMVVMGGLVFDKFFRHDELRDSLVRTGNTALFYYDSHDWFWGLDPNSNRKSKNMLGAILEATYQYWSHLRGFGSISRSTR